MFRSEHDGRERVDRKRAERAARRDVDTESDRSERGRDGRR